MMGLRPAALEARGGQERLWRSIWLTVWKRAQGGALSPNCLRSEPVAKTLCHVEILGICYGFLLRDHNMPPPEKLRWILQAICWRRAARSRLSLLVCEGVRRDLSRVSALSLATWS